MAQGRSHLGTKGFVLEGIDEIGSRKWRNIFAVVKLPRLEGTAREKFPSKSCSVFVFPSIWGLKRM